MRGPWYDFEHNLQWASDCFEFLFRQPIEIAVQYLNDPEFLDRMEKDSAYKPVEVLTTIKLTLVDQWPSSFQDCVAWVRCYWQEQFCNKIRQLLVNFPEDHLTTSGQPFWLSPKQCPMPLEFSVDDPVHLDFVVAAANLKAEVYGIEQVRDRERIVLMVQQVSVSEFKPRAEHVQDIADRDRENLYEQLKKEIPSPEHFKDLHLKVLNFTQTPENSETNFHLDFIMATCRMRASNYKQPSTYHFRYSEKRCESFPIPALATTSSVVSGLVSLELLKMVQGHRTLHPYKNCCVNLALPFFGFFEPIAPPKVNYDGTELNFWDYLVLRGEMTLLEFLRYFHERLNIYIESVSQGKFLLLAESLGEEECTERIEMTMGKVWERASEKTLQPDVHSLVLVVKGSMENQTPQIFLVRYVLWLRREGPC